MKTQTTGQDGLINSYGQKFAEWIYDEFPHPTAFSARQAQSFPLFKAMALETKKRYTRVLLMWMREQAPEHLQRFGYSYTT